MLKVTPAISFFLFATVALTEGVEKGTSGKPGLLRNSEPRVLQKTNNGNNGSNGQPGSKAQKASKTAVCDLNYVLTSLYSHGMRSNLNDLHPLKLKPKQLICHYDSSDACPLKTIEVAATGAAAHMENHEEDFNGTCDAKCQDEGGTYNNVTCACDVDDIGSVRFLQVAEVGEEWGRLV